MKKVLIFVIVIILAIAVLVGISLNNQKPKELVKENTGTQYDIEQSLPWLEVVAGKTFELQADEITIKKELLTGDYILEEMVLKTDVSGKAIIHYPEGSELRLEKDTLLKFEKGSFDTKNDSLKVQVKLVIGRVWSKIIELATPDSQWEVKTSNAVATVRGTAFGMEADAKKNTKIIGSENSVKVSMRNEKTETLVKTDLMITKDKVLEINDVVADKVIALKKTGDEEISSTTMRQLISERSTVTADLKDGWVKESEDKDDKIRAKVQDLKDKNIDKQEIRDILKEDIKKDYQEKTKQTKEDVIERLKDSPAAKNIINKQIIDKLIQEREDSKLPISKEINDTTKEDLNKDFQKEIEQKIEPVIEKPIEKPIIKNELPINGVTDVKPYSFPFDFSTAKLEVVSKTTNFNIVEGTEIQFNAFVLLPDGTRKDITSMTAWGVVGNIGKINSTGNFLSEIGIEESENEFSNGSIVAIIKKMDGEDMRGFSKLITVSHKIVNDVLAPEDIGGQ